MSSPDMNWMKVLLVEDNAFAQEIMRTILRHIGVGDVQICDDGAKALARAAAENFDLLIVDWRLPSMNGVALTEGVRSLADRTRASTTIIMVTAHADAQHVVQARRAGVDAFLVKPTSIQAVRDRITGLIESGRLKPSRPFPLPDGNDGVVPTDEADTRDGDGRLQ